MSQPQRTPSRAPHPRRPKEPQKQSSRLQWIAAGVAAVAEMLSVHMLVVSPLNIRQTPFLQEGDEWEEFVESVNGGITVPLQVRQLPTRDAPLEGPRFEVIDGQRRLAAAKAAGVARVPVLRVTEKDDIKVLLMSARANQWRHDVSALDWAQVAKRLLEEEGPKGQKRFASQAAVAAALGVSPARVSAWLSLLDLPPEVHERVARGEVTQKAAEKIAQAFPNADQQRRAAELAATLGPTQADQVEVVKAVRDDPALLAAAPTEVKARAKKAHASRLRARAAKYDPSAPTPAPTARAAPPAAIAEKEREALLDKCERLGYHDLAAEVRDLDAETGHARFEEVRTRIQNDIEQSVATQQEAAKEAEAARQRAISPNPEAVAAASDIHAPLRAPNAPLVTREELDAAERLIDSIGPIPVHLHAHAEGPPTPTRLDLDESDIQGLRQAVLRAVVGRLREAGLINELLGTHTKEGPEETYATAEGDQG